MERYAWPKREIFCVGVVTAVFLVASCFQTDALMYAPCLDSQMCQSGKQLACALSEAEGLRGFCTQPCEKMSDDPCPMPVLDGDAQPICIEIATQPVCALSCDENSACPEGMECQPSFSGGASFALCFPSGSPTQ